MKSELVGLIPAAGSGTRLYPFARAVPKEMYPILGKAVIEHCVENLREGGIERIYMIVGHQKGSLMDYIGDGSYFGVKAAYIYQPKRKGLGHAILQAQDWINTAFVTLLGDSFIEPKSEIKELIDLHIKEKPIATVLVFKVSDPSAYGVVKFGKMENGWGFVEKLAEKPDKNKAKDFGNGGSYYAITGAYVFEPRIFEYIRKTKPDKNGEIQITDALSVALGSGEKVCAMILKGTYIDIGKWRTVLEIEKRLMTSTDIEEHIRERERFVKKLRDE